MAFVLLLIVVVLAVLAIVALLYRYEVKRSEDLSDLRARVDKQVDELYPFPEPPLASRPASTKAPEPTCCEQCGWWLQNVKPRENGQQLCDMCAAREA